MLTDTDIHTMAPNQRTLWRRCQLFARFGDESLRRVLWRRRLEATAAGDGTQETHLAQMKGQLHLTSKTPTLRHLIGIIDVAQCHQ